ncbi:amidohydrolase family protein [Pseudonocardia xishanensis]|uniref:Amidohydrolase family protein n=1 Tax=Pseudonocardia xishanensis TaxID=630995 RepID=A0ABP8RHH6_9PSEU
MIDVHAHWLPADLFALPPGAPYGPLQDRGGELHLGEVPLSIAPAAMSDVSAIRADMAAAGIEVRVLSAPPFAFPVGGPAPEYVAAFNAALADVVAGSDGAFRGLGLVDLDSTDSASATLAALADAAGIAGVAVPPVLGGTSFDRGVLRHVLGEAARLGLSVLVHPMQLPRPEWDHHYLPNLVGNPVETATAVAALLLGGVKDELPDLRLCVVHGGGCTPGLLGRWDHGWRTRPDVRQDSTRPPGDVVRELWFDTVTHDPDLLALLTTRVGKGAVVCGSDYPFDMAQADPLGFATSTGLDAAALAANARAFLGEP